MSESADLLGVAHLCTCALTSEASRWPGPGCRDALHVPGPRRLNVHGCCAGGKSRMQQIVDWLGADFDGVIVFDEVPLPLPHESS